MKKNHTIMKMLFIFVNLTLILIIDINLVYASETSYTITDSPKFSQIPIVCIFEPNEPRARDVIRNEWIKQTKMGVQSWEIALKNSETSYSNKWNIHVEEISLKEEETFDNSKCRVEVRFTGIPLKENPNAVGWEYYDGEKSQIKLFYIRPEICGHKFDPEEEKNFPEFCLDDEFRRSKEIGNIAAHEFGHSMGLGHFQSSDPEINQKWSLDPVSSPSIMTLSIHYDETKNPIRKIDVEKLKEIYGYRGFETFANLDSFQNKSPHEPPFPEDDVLKNRDSQTIQKIPPWIKNIPQWWITNDISDADFLRGMTYLVKNEILIIPNSLRSQTDEVTVILPIDGIISSLTTKTIKKSTIEELPLNQYLPNDKDPTEKNSSSWIMIKEGYDSINYDGDGINGYFKNFSKPKDGSVIETSIHKFDSGGDAWSFNYLDLSDVKKESIQGLENMSWPSKPEKCIGFVEEKNNKDVSRAYCVIGNLQFHIFGYGLNSQRDVRDFTAIINSNINELLNSQTKSPDLIQKQTSNTISVTINTTEILIPYESANENLFFSGKIAEPKQGLPLIIDFVFPDNTSSRLELHLTNKGDFGGLFPILKSFPSGKYDAHFIYGDEEYGSMSFQIFKNIPNDLKYDIQSRLNDDSDLEFLKKILLLEKNGFLS